MASARSRISEGERPRPWTKIATAAAVCSSGPMAIAGLSMRLPVPLPPRAPLCREVGRHLDLLERRDDFRAPILEPWRQQHLLAEFVHRLVDGEADVGRGDLAENAAGRPAIDRVEIVAVFDLGHVRIAEAF